MLGWVRKFVAQNYSEYTSTLLGKYLKEQLRGINSVDSQLVYHRGGIGDRAAVFMKGMQCCIVPGFVTRDLVALQIKIEESGDQKDVICSAYFSLDFGTSSPLKDSRN